MIFLLLTLQDMGMLGFVGPTYQQASQMVFPLLDRLLRHHRLTLRLMQMGILWMYSRLVLQHLLSFLVCTAVPRQWPHMHRESSVTSQVSEHLNTEHCTQLKPKEECGKLIQRGEVK